MPPYSDNMYSDTGHEDEEDFADQLSPSDGYFSSSSPTNAVPSVPNVMVPDPTLQRQAETTAEAKAREASEESGGGPPLSRPGAPLSSGPREHSDRATTTSSFVTRPSHSTQYTPWSSSSSSHAASSSSASSYGQGLRSLPYGGGRGGRTPSVYSDAPPAYAPSPTTALSPSSPSYQQSNYSTFSNRHTMGVEDQTLLSRDPQSMGQPNTEDDLPTPTWTGRIRRRLPARLSWKMVVLAVVLLVVSALYLGGAFSGEGSKNEHNIPPDQEPKQPPEGQLPPEDPSDMDSWRPTFCQNAQHRYADQMMAVDFSAGNNLTFSQDWHSHHGDMAVKIAGQVDVRRLSQGGNPRVVVEAVTNDKSLLLDVLIDESDQYMKVSVPKRYRPPTVKGDWPCVEIKTTIWVPEGGELDYLSIETVHLDILLMDDLSLKVEKYSRLASTVGAIISGADKPATYGGPGGSIEGADKDLPDFTYVPAKDSYKLDSRIIEVTATSGTISGNWPLYDMLGFHSTSGPVKVSISPQPVLDTAPKPAVLSVTSTSGTVHMSEPIHDTSLIPIRDYLVDVHSTSGDIHGALAFGSGCELKTIASQIAVDLLPVLNKDEHLPSSPAQLETVSTSGSTAIRVLEPVWYTGSLTAREPIEDVPFIPIGGGDPYDLPPARRHTKSSDQSRATDSSSYTLLSEKRPLDCIQAAHKSTSAAIGIRYPQSWVGNLVAESISGSLDVKGRDVVVTRKQSGWPSRSLQAYKGRNGGGSTVRVHLLTGDLDAVLGDV